MVFDDESKTTRAVCWGLNWDEDYDLLRYVAAAKGTATHFLFLPILLIDVGIHKLARFVESRRIDASLVQAYIGMDDYFDVRIRKEGLTERISSLDLNHATERLTSLYQSTVGLSCCCKAQMRFVLQLENMLKETNGESTSALHLKENVQRAFEYRLSYLRDSIISIQSEVDSLDQAISGLVQTVSNAKANAGDDLADFIQVYSLIAQKDSQNSYSSALSAQRTAIFTARDSTDMRVIAAMTLIFLPGTFMATLFSTSFFSFQTPGQPRIVSPWIWVYPVATVSLMMSVIAVWAVWSYFERSKLGKQIHDDNILSLGSDHAHAVRRGLFQWPATWFRPSARQRNLDPTEALPSDTMDRKRRWVLARPLLSIMGPRDLKRRIARLRIIPYAPFLGNTHDGAASDSKLKRLYQPPLSSTLAEMVNPISIATMPEESTAGPPGAAQVSKNVGRSVGAPPDPKGIISPLQPQISPPPARGPIFAQTANPVEITSKPKEVAADPSAVARKQKPENIDIEASTGAQPTLEPDSDGVEDYQWLQSGAKRRFGHRDLKPGNDLLFRLRMIDAMPNPAKFVDFSETSDSDPSAVKQSNASREIEEEEGAEGQESLKTDGWRMTANKPEGATAGLSSVASEQSFDDHIEASAGTQPTSNPNNNDKDDLIRGSSDYDKEAILKPIEESEECPMEENPLFWVKGKPGIERSSLMKFLDFSEQPDSDHSAAEASAGLQPDSKPNEDKLKFSQRHQGSEKDREDLWEAKGERASEIVARKQRMLEIYQQKHLQEMAEQKKVRETLDDAMPNPIKIVDFSGRSDSDRSVAETSDMGNELKIVQAKRANRYSGTTLVRDWSATLW
jgi:hypothetical protein